MATIQTSDNFLFSTMALESSEEDFLFGIYGFFCKSRCFVRTMFTLNFLPFMYLYIRKTKKVTEL